MQSQVLQLDIQGTPQAWISPEQAALHLTTEDVAWSIGGDDPLTVLRGGYNAHLQRQSCLAIPPIIALRGQARVNLFDVEPTVTRRKLFIRDRFTCAYCGGHYDHRKLQAEHIHPESRGGAYTWLNLVSACRMQCTQRGAPPRGSWHAAALRPLRAKPFRGLPLAGKKHPSRCARMAGLSPTEKLPPQLIPAGPTCGDFFWKPDKTRITPCAQRSQTGTASRSRSGAHQAIRRWQPGRLKEAVQIRRCSQASFRWPPPGVLRTRPTSTPP